MEMEYDRAPMPEPTVPEWRPHPPDREAAYVCVAVVIAAILAALMAGCVSAPLASDAPRPLYTFHLASAHVAIERPKLPDSLKGKTDENETGSAAVDDRPLCVLYRERWMEIADSDEIDKRFRVVVKLSDAIPDAIKRNGMRLPLMHWTFEGHHVAEYRGAEQFNRVFMRVRNEPQQVGYAKQWTYPGDIFDHLREGHGKDASGMTRAEAEREHDRLHNERVRAVSGNCPGGVCPVRRRR